MEQLSRIFGTEGRLKLLRLFLFNQDSALSPEEIAARAKLALPVVRRELQDLVKSGFLRRKKARGALTYQVNTRFTPFVHLERFIRDTTSVSPQKIVAGMRRAGNVRLVALSGLFTGTLESRVDLLVVGDDLDERVLAGVVRSLEAELGREIRYASFPTADFRYRMGVYDRLLRDVFDYPHRLLVDKIGV